MRIYKSLPYCLFLLLLCSQTIPAQDFQKPINYRFDGNEVAFRELLTNKIRYPEEAINKNIIGFSISSITITPRGEITDISIINPIDPSIDQEVQRLLKLTKKHWIGNDTIMSNQTFYVQIIFTVPGSGLEIEEANYIKNNPYFIEPIGVFAIPFGSTARPASTQSILNQCTELINLGNFEEALPLINELIKREPINQNLYQIRIRILNKTSRTDLINNDIQKIANFIPGSSLEELIKN